MSVFEKFIKKHNFLICVDSDGCVMNTMNSKHINCFGPCLIEEWALFRWEQEILYRWNEVNLFQKTRGINRFKGLAVLLSEINEKYENIPGLEDYIFWVNNSKSLSNETLSTAIGTAPTEDAKLCLSKALHWSKEVNKKISDLPDEDKTAFCGVKPALSAAREFADIAVVTSANRDAVCEEWQTCGLYDVVDIVLAQDSGSKAYCIEKMLDFGYDPNHVLMVGDAIGDKSSAEGNGVLFFPILVNNEEKSWEELKNTGLPNLKNGSFAGEYQVHINNAFLTALGG